MLNAEQTTQSLISASDNGFVWEAKALTRARGVSEAGRQPSSVAAVTTNQMESCVSLRLYTSDFSPLQSIVNILLYQGLPALHLVMSQVATITA